VVDETGKVAFAALEDLVYRAAIDRGLHAIKIVN